MRWLKFIILLIVIVEKEKKIIIEKCIRQKSRLNPFEEQWEGKKKRNYDYIIKSHVKTALFID